jgi:phosphoribosylaminoimidazolecarboxamide formyltransferase/IMP cyclohydrolase
MNPLFFEVVIAPSYDPQALEILKSKKNRIILQTDTAKPLPEKEFRSLLNGVIDHDRDNKVQHPASFTLATHKAPSKAQVNDLVFANKQSTHQIKCHCTGRKREIDLQR